MRTANGEPVILVVEDSEVDYETTLRAFRAAGVKKGLHHCADGEQALDYLYRRGEYAAPNSAPVPDLILLDLNLPGTDGIKVIEEIKGDPKLRGIPVIILSTSSLIRDIDASYRAGANAYINKPLTLEEFYDTIQAFKEFWINRALLPTEELQP